MVCVCVVMLFYLGKELGCISSVQGQNSGSGQVLVATSPDS